MLSRLLSDGMTTGLNIQWGSEWQTWSIIKMCLFGECKVLEWCLKSSEKQSGTQMTMKKSSLSTFDHSKTGQRKVQYSDELGYSVSSIPIPTVVVYKISLFV